MEQCAAPSLGHFVHNLLSAKIENAIFNKTVPSKGKIYQYDFPKVPVLKHSTNGAMVSSSFCRAPCI